MLSEDKLLQIFIENDISVVGRAVVNNIRNQPPSRRVGGGTNNVVCRFASKKMGCVIQAESHKAELPFIYLWEHDPNTLEYYDQPPKVKLAYLNASGSRVTHMSTPDFFLIQSNWMGWVEIKTEEELTALVQKGGERFIPDDAGGWRCPPGERFASEFGLGFRVLSTKEVNWVLIRNLEFLSDYLGEDHEIAINEGAGTKYSQCFDGQRWLPLEHLLTSCDLSADQVYWSIAKGELFVDLENELLSEPQYTNVCRDKLSAQIYKQNHLACAQPRKTLQTIRLTQGSQLTWDGTPWKILNAGTNEIFLENSVGTILSLRLDQFQQLVGAGSIVGTPYDAPENFALQALNRASPGDLEAAIRRCESLSKPEALSSVPARTIRYWRKRAREGEIAYGNSLLGLLPRISSRGNRNRKVDRLVIETMNSVIDAHLLTANQLTQSVCYGMVRNKCEVMGLLPPSSKTFAAEIKRRKEDEIVRARSGRKAAYAITEFCWVIDQSTPRHGERPYEIGHIDHTELDVELVDSRTGANLGRPWLSIMLDAFTRQILAFFITFDPPSYRSCMAVIRECVKRHGRIPRTIVVDQGSEFEGMYFEALLARLGTHKKSRPASKGRFGSVIERWFGINNKAFIHNLAGNSQALQKPRSMSPSHDPRTLACWTLQQLTESMTRFIDEIYANLGHPALGVSPREAMSRGLAMSGARDHLLIPYTDDFIRLTMPTTPAGRAIVRVGRGIQIKGIQYWHPIFREPHIVRTKVPVAYDPFDVSQAFAYAGGSWVRCRSEYQSLLERRTEREIAAITQEIRQLRYLAGKNRNINGQRIAAFVSQELKTEAVLKQQRRDAEHREASLPTEASGTQSSPPLVGLSQASPDLWSIPISFEAMEVL